MNSLKLMTAEVGCDVQRYCRRRTSAGSERLCICLKKTQAQTFSVSQTENCAGKIFFARIRKIAAACPAL